MLDPSNSTKNVVHFMLPKPAVMQIAEQINKNGQSAEGLMTFTLAPSSTSPSSAMASNHTQMSYIDIRSQSPPNSYAIISCIIDKCVLGLGLPDISVQEKT